MGENIDPVNIEVKINLVQWLYIAFRNYSQEEAKCLE